MQVKILEATNAELTEFSEVQTIKIRERDTKIYQLQAQVIKYENSQDELQANLTYEKTNGENQKNLAKKWEENTHKITIEKEKREK